MLCNYLKKSRCARCSSLLSVDRRKIPGTNTNSRCEAARKRDPSRNHDNTLKLLGKFDQSWGPTSVPFHTLRT